jgi:hypothetical protein
LGRRTSRRWWTWSRGRRAGRSLLKCPPRGPTWAAYPQMSASRTKRCSLPSSVPHGDMWRPREPRSGGFVRGQGQRTATFPGDRLQMSRVRANERNRRGCELGRGLRAPVPRLEGASGPVVFSGSPTGRQSLGGHRAEIAQLVEHATENRGVASSILALGTTSVVACIERKWLSW